MRPKLQKQSALKIDGRIIPDAQYPELNLPRYCRQSEKLLQKSKEDEDVIKEIIYKGI